MIKKTFSVIGLGYGDEGKGSVVDYLASKYPDKTLVVRHSGGHQVGHTVKVDGIIHEFRNFGSGTFRGVPTYYDKVCTISPIGFDIEYNVLYKKNPVITPVVYVHPLCPVTTICDIAFNRAKDRMLSHGSVGLGFGATLQRSEKLPIYAFNLKYPLILEQKLKEVFSYYHYMICNMGREMKVEYYNQLDKLEKEGFTKQKFFDSCQFFIETVQLKDFYSDDDFYDSFENIIHEGNQGILLDRYHGFFPHVTYGRTTNATVGAVNEVYYVTRAYATKHGAGDLLYEEDTPLTLINNEDEQNVINPYQGEFRSAILSYDMIRYAIEADLHDTRDNSAFNNHDKKHLVITCMDQIENPKITILLENGEFAKAPLISEMFEGLVDEVLFNTSADSATMKVVKEFNYDNN